MPSISEIIKQHQPSKPRLNERAECIKFFLEKITDKQGKQYKPARMAVLLSHIKTPDLHYSISIFKDTERRRGKVAAQKEFFWSIKSNK